MLEKWIKTLKAAEVSNVREVRRQGGLAHQEEACSGPHWSTVLGILTELQPLKGTVLLLQPLTRLQNLLVRRKRPFLCLCHLGGRGVLFGGLSWFLLVWSKSQKVMVAVVGLEVHDQVAGKVGWFPVGPKGVSALFSPLASVGLLASFVLPRLVDASPRSLPSSSHDLLLACVPGSQSVQG